VESHSPQLQVKVTQGQKIVHHYTQTSSLLPYENCKYYKSLNLYHVYYSIPNNYTNHETKFVIYRIRQQVYSLQKHRTITEHNKQGKDTNPLLWKPHKENQLNGNNVQSNNLGFKYSNNITNGVSTQMLDSSYKQTLFNTLTTNNSMQLCKTE